jgi:regulator of protease activity HflC (stomatin/prohibitin superfamily)
MDDDKILKAMTGWGIAIVMLVASGVAAGMYGCPRYKVYEQRLSGAAKLAEAESSRQIAIQEAHAKMESAKMLADAEIARARGVAEANKIIGDSLKGNEEYLRYLWIHNLETGNNAVIYVPTEAGLPILEAGKRRTAEAP